MTTINKGNVVITKMNFDETGVVSPSLLCLLTPLLNRGHTINEAKEIKVIMDFHSLSICEAERKRAENLEWV